MIRSTYQRATGLTTSADQFLLLVVILSISQIEIYTQQLKMPTKSSFPDVDIPDVDLWALMFDRKNRGFSDDKGRTQDGDERA